MTEYLLKNICSRRPPVTVVWGNLGRRLSLLRYYIDVCFDPYVVVRIRSDLHESLAEDQSACDVLIWLEPDFLETVSRPDYAERMIVLTSHLSLTLPSDAPVILHHVGDIERGIPRNFSGYVDRVPADDDDDDAPLVVFRPPLLQTGTVDEYPPIVREETVVVDLTECKTARELYLSLLNAREYLGPKGTLVRSWTVALSFLLKGSMESHLDRTMNRGKRVFTDNNVDGLCKMRKHYLFHRRNVSKESTP
ncbi:hypothetical protein RF55_19272 [Lasius niger]|uniref:Uncharacterized protein n=1 Tax=Lasius niger TaxID=67767 RepID=A0A0J7K075_LASNI|nr:hypothetical protein RF55_19272 [Lasius niger]